MSFSSSSSSSSPLCKNLKNSGPRQNLLEEWIGHNDVNFHRFDVWEAEEIRKKLLGWYETNRRRLPWRGDPPPWDGSTAHFGSATEEKLKRKVTKKQQLGQSTSFSSGSSNLLDGETTSETYPVSAYGVWVSEIMLQQTRVEAVVPYWLRWMKAFPTVQELAAASEDEVNAMWAGLGFYRRARLLHKAAKQVVQEENGQIPDTVEGLLRLPGIGRYTACAIASIAYNVTVPVVDGNVCRVLARLKAIANHVKSPALKDAHGWELARILVEAGDGSQPGDFNQAIMELGATYCAPSGTGTHPNDPLREFYYSTQLGRELANALARDMKLEPSLPRNTCQVCAENGVEEALQSLVASLQQGKQHQQQPSETNKDDFASSCGHKAFPTPPPKTNKREDVLAVAVLSCKSSSNGNKDIAWLLVRRNRDDGLLAGQWEFPSSIVWSSSEAGQKKKDGRQKSIDNHSVLPVVPAGRRKKALDKVVEDLSDVDASLATLPRTKRQSLSEPIEHVFSHVRHTMWIEYAHIGEMSCSNNLAMDEKCDNSTNRLTSTLRWMTISDMQKVGVTAEVKKILHAVTEIQALEQNAAQGLGLAQKKRPRRN